VHTLRTLGDSHRNETPDPTAPEAFRTAITSLQAADARAEISIQSVRPPQRLAPWSYALTADVLTPDDGEAASGRFVVLYDPEGVPAWDGELRLVVFVGAELEVDIATDPSLPAVCWSWLTDALGQRQADFTAAGGTVTLTSSTRFGDLHGPQATVSIELRASWTARDSDLAPHLSSFIDLLSMAAGLPPEGVSVLPTS
jgi:hypothetical protein